MSAYTPLMNTLRIIEADSPHIKIGLFRRRRDLRLIETKLNYLEEHSGHAETMALQSFGQAVDSFIAAKLRNYPPSQWGRLAVVCTETISSGFDNRPYNCLELTHHRSLLLVKSQLWAAPWEKAREGQDKQRRAVQRAMLEAGQYPTLSSNVDEIKKVLSEIQHSAWLNLNSFFERFTMKFSRISN